MSKKAIKKLMAKNGSTYQSNGQTKNSYTRCGVLMQDQENGEYSIKIEALPVNFDGWLNAWDMDGDKVKQDSGLNQAPQNQAPNQNGYSSYNQAPMQNQAPQQQAPSNNDDFDDDIPF